MTESQETFDWAPFGYAPYSGFNRFGRPKKILLRPTPNERTCMGWHKRHAPVSGARGAFTSRGAKPRGLKSCSGTYMSIYIYLVNDGVIKRREDKRREGISNFSIPQCVYCVLKFSLMSLSILSHLRFLHSSLYIYMYISKSTSRNEMNGNKGMTLIQSLSLLSSSSLCKWQHFHNRTSFEYRIR